MGKPCFSKAVKFFAFALLGMAIAIAAIAVLSSPAAADSHTRGGGGGRVEERAWDTDNLKIGCTYSARSFAVPHYGSQGDPARTGTRTSGLLTLTENHSPCQPAVMDGFFQNKASQPRNDLPKLEKTAATENKWKETPGHICDSFMTAQNLAISRAASTGGYWLDSNGKLQKGGFGSWMRVSRDATAPTDRWDPRSSDDGTTDCASTAADPPQQAGFTADPCVTASLEIYENRIVGSDAEPGVAVSDRTLVVAAGRTAWDLDVTSPHPLTASPPRDTTAGSGDPDGCADGSESRPCQQPGRCGIQKRRHLFTLKLADFGNSG